MAAAAGRRAPSTATSWSDEGYGRSWLYSLLLRVSILHRQESPFYGDIPDAAGPGGGSGAPDSHLFRVENGRLRYVHTLTHLLQANFKGSGGKP